MSTSTTQPKSTPTKAVKFLWRTFWIGLLSVILLFTLANFGVFGRIPSLEELQNPEASLATEIYSADGKLMGKYYAENRSEVKFEDISPNVIHALIATEDERFYDHSGIDAKAVLRAIKSFGKDGGGSTLTQQTAKMILGQGGGNIFKRGLEKVKEWIVAVKLERNFTKEEIIALYLNRAPWVNTYGIRNASRTYFQKEPRDLKLEEAAVLVGMLKGSSIYNPVKKPKEALDRRNTVLNQMVVCEHQYLTEAQATVLKAKPLIHAFKPLDEDLGIAPHFRRALQTKLQEWAKNTKNPRTGEPYNLYRDGLKIYTTLDSRMQQYAEEAVENHMPNIQKKLNWIVKVSGNRFWKGHEKTIDDAMKFSDRYKELKEANLTDAQIAANFQVKVPMKVFSWNKKHETDTIMSPYDSIKYHKQILQTSFSAMDPVTGEVKCWVGSIDFKWFKFDHVLQHRQVGSTFKPFVYALAVEDVGYDLDTQIPGGSLTLGGKNISGGGGAMANCLAMSKNLAAWRLIGTVGVKRTIEFAQTAGIKTKLPAYYSIALGTGEIPLPEMLQGYTMFPNKGLSVEPLLFTRIEDKNGNLVQEFTSFPKQVLSESSAFKMVQMMQGVIKAGTAKSLNKYNIPVEKGGKTGTTNSNADGWFIGYTTELVAGTWVGCDDPFIRIYANNAGGAEMSAPSWGMFMQKVYADKKLKYGVKKTFEKPAVEDPQEFFGEAQVAQFYNKTDGGNYVESEDGQVTEKGDDYFSEGGDGGYEGMGTTENPPATDTGKNKTPATKPKPNAEPAKKPAAPKPTTDKDNDYKK
jgi:penicillin-binding protein 1A